MLEMEDKVGQGINSEYWVLKISPLLQLFKQLHALQYCTYR